MQLKRIPLVMLIAGAIFGQQSQDLKIQSVTVSGEPPLRPVTCQKSTYGYLHIDDRTKLTKAEIGEYILTATKDGAVVTVYPESKSGIFVYCNCSTQP